jgi:putative transposase
MPIRITPLVTDNFYHIFNRGVNRRQIFTNKRDYIRALNTLKFFNYVDYPIRYSKFLLLANGQRKEIWDRLDKSNTFTDIISFCLMPNQFHLLLKQNRDEGISKLLANFQISYTKYFNIKNDRVGSLLQGQFKAVKIDSEEQLLHVSRYVHLNPYSSAVIENIKDLLKYEWSSLPEYAQNNQYDLCKNNILLNYFKNNTEYIDFVLNNADYQKDLENIKHLTFEA